jgi:hypothetical protein
MEAHFIPVTLDTNQVYTFTLIERLKGGGVDVELIRLQPEGKAVIDLDTCEVHKVKMEYKPVPITYGLPVHGTNEPSLQTEQQLFPHYREFLEGGCVSDSDSPKTGRLFVCRRCKADYEDWRQGKNHRVIFVSPY